MKHNHFYRSKQKLRESFIIFLNIRYVHILAQTLFFLGGGGMNARIQLVYFFLYSQVSVGEGERGYNKVAFSGGKSTL